VKALTQRQQQVLDCVRESIAKRGYPPSLREIGAKLGIGSTNGVNDHLKALEAKGMLTRDTKTNRGLHVVGDTYGQLCHACGAELARDLASKAQANAIAKLRQLAEDAGVTIEVAE
jgi:SOS-response transcriptional repressor LexA